MRPQSRVARGGFSGGLSGAFAAAILFAVVLASPAALQAAPPDVTYVRHGVLDLRTVGSVRLRKAFALEGEWQFVRGQFPLPGQWDPAAGFRWAPLPWNQSRRVGGTFYPAFSGRGAGAYRLRILLPPDRQAQSPVLALHIPDLNTAYRLYINGKLYRSVGRVGLTEHTTQSAFVPGVVFFPYSSELELVFHIANFEHRKGGLDETILLGPAPLISYERDLELGRTLFVVGCIFLTGVYHLILFFLRPAERSALYFSAFCFCLSLRGMVTGAYFLTSMWPSIPFTLLMRLEYWTLFGSLPLVAVFLRERFPFEFNRTVIRVFVALGVAAVVFTLIAPLRIYSLGLMPFHAVLGLYIVYAVYAVVRAMRNGRNGAIAVLTGGIIFAVSAVIDILHNYYILRFVDGVVGYGFLFFILSQSYILSLGAARAYYLAAGLSRRLEERVKARTQELEESRDRLTDTLHELSGARDRAEASNRAKSEFVAVMSHEIRTPLNSIIGTTELLADAELPTRERNYVNVLRRAAGNLKGQVDDILDFSKIEARALEVESVAFDLREVIESVVGILQGRAQAKGLRLLTSLRGLPRGKLLGDPRRLEQILMNLMGNAVKFTAYGLVQLDVHELSRHNKKCQVMFRILDTGVGIPEEKLEEVFDRFAQADSSTTRRYGGSGLGLAIARRLAEIMGGEIAVESEAGTGSVFHLRMPFVVAPLQSALPAAPVPEAPQGLRILVAEDNPDNLFLVKQFLRPIKAEIHAVGDGTEAVQLFEREQFDLVLMDIQMPTMDGVEATGRLRAYEAANPTRRRTPILALTANASPQDVERSRMAGCDDHLPKPIARQKLLDAVARHTARPSR